MDILGGKVNILIGDVREKLRELPDDSVDCVVTSPPYWGLRDYGTARWEGGSADCQHERVDTARTAWANSVKGPGNPGKNGSTYANMTKEVGGRCGKCGAVHVDHQIGLEPTLGEHLAVMVDVFREVRRVLKPTGTMWLNCGDCYATSPNGRSAADTKDAGNDDRTFRDKPFSTIGPIYAPHHSDPLRRDIGRRGGGRNSDPTLKPKDLCMIPNRLAIALQDDGWWVRSEIIWHKPNPMPESTRDRPTSSHEKIWLMTKRERYFYDADAIAEPTESPLRDILRATILGRGTQDYSNASGANGRQPQQDNSGGFPVRNKDNPTRNSRNVWTIGTAAFSEAHFATFPPELAERCIKAGSPQGGSVLDPFGGAGTTGLVAASLGRTATLIELNPEYATLAQARIEAAFMGKEEGIRHMVKQLGKAEEPGPLFAGL